MEWKSCSLFHEQTQLFHSEGAKGMDLEKTTNQIWKASTSRDIISLASLMAAKILSEIYTYAVPVAP